MRCAAKDRQALAQLCRYITRPALAYDRVQTAAVSQLVLELKTPWRDGTTHLVMSPLEFMQRMAALVHRPRLHLIRFHGVLARATASGRPIHDGECRQRVGCRCSQSAVERPLGDLLLTFASGWPLSTTQESIAVVRRAVLDGHNRSLETRSERVNFSSKPFEHVFQGVLDPLAAPKKSLYGRSTGSNLRLHGCPEVKSKNSQTLRISPAGPPWKTGLRPPT